MNHDMNGEYENRRYPYYEVTIATIRMNNATAIFKSMVRLLLGD